MANEFDTNDDVRKLTLNVDVQEKSACERHVKIEVSLDDVVFYFDREYDDLQKNQAIPGFRAGKAPRKMIEKRFRKDVKERVKQALISDSLTQMNEERNIVPISEPDFKLDSIILVDDAPFIYEFDVEVRPTFDIPNWKGLKLDKLTHEFTSQEVDAAIENLRKDFGTLEDKNEPAAIDDYIVTKLSFELDGEILSSSERETIRVRQTLSFHDCVIDGFGELITGVVPGDVRKTTTTISDNSRNDKVRGKEVEAIFEILEVKKAVLPELNDEFLQMLGGFENMGDFRDVVLENLQRHMEYEQQQTVRRQITAQLTADANWELPPALLRRQQTREFQRAILELRRSGFSEDQIISHQNVLIRNAAATTAQALKEHFLFEAIAESEGVQDEDRDYESEIMLIAAQSGETPRRVQSRLEKSGNMDVLRNQIIERKVIAKIMEFAEFVEVPYRPAGTLSDEAVDRSVGNAEEVEIPEVSEEDAKAANREASEGKV